MALDTKPLWYLTRHSVGEIVEQAQNGHWIARPGKVSRWRDLRRQLAKRCFDVAWVGPYLLILHGRALSFLPALRGVAQEAIRWDRTAIAMFHDLLLEMDLGGRERESWLLNGFRKCKVNNLDPPGGDS